MALPFSIHSDLRCTPHQSAHAVEKFRLLGGGVFGDTPAEPGTSHVTLVDRADWLVSMIDAFLDAPVEET